MKKQIAYAVVDKDGDICCIELERDFAKVYVARFSSPKTGLDRLGVEIHGKVKIIKVLITPL